MWASVKVTNTPGVQTQQELKLISRLFFIDFPGTQENECRPGGRKKQLLGERHEADAFP